MGENAEKTGGRFELGCAKQRAPVYLEKYNSCERARCSRRRAGYAPLPLSTGQTRLVLLILHYGFKRSYASAGGMRMQGRATSTCPL